MCSHSAWIESVSLNVRATGLTHKEICSKCYFSIEYKQGKYLLVFFQDFILFPILIFCLPDLQTAEPFPGLSETLSLITFCSTPHISVYLAQRPTCDQAKANLL